MARWSGFDSERMNQLGTLLSRITDPKARKPNKMTRSRKHKKVNKVVIVDIPVRYPDGAMTADKRL